MPLVGAVVGALAGLAAWAVSLVLPHPLAVAVAFGVSVIATGAIHIDGFLDSCDALFASVPVARRLEILKDPRHGTFAVAFFAVICVIWLAALWSIPPPHLPAVLAFTGASARWSTVWIARIVPYAGGGAIAHAFLAKPPLWAQIAGGALVVALGVGCGGATIVLALTGVLTVLAGIALASRLGGGLTGDVYGFLIVTTEVVMLALVPLTRA
ncbi:MAG: hypothetical protein NVS2B17_08190 [Candidatus Velthaea sp.]